MKKEYKYRLYIFFNNKPIQGPYPTNNIIDYKDMLDELFLTDDYPLVHVSIIKHENDSDSPFLSCYSKEDYLDFRETYLVNDKPKILTREMKKCNMNYGEEVEKQKYTNL